MARIEEVQHYGKPLWVSGERGKQEDWIYFHGGDEVLATARIVGGTTVLELFIHPEFDDGLDKADREEVLTQVFKKLLVMYPKIHEVALQYGKGQISMFEPYGFELSKRSEAGSNSVYFACKRKESATEAQRANQFLAQSRQKKYKGSTRSRYDARSDVSVNGGAREWVEQDANMLFKTGNYLFTVPVHGKTADYSVVIKILDFLPRLNKALETKQFSVPTFQSVLMDSMNNDMMQTSCSCPDWRYRSSYQSTVNDDNSGRPENRPARITNPTGEKYCCKHINYVLSRKLWATKAARNLFNYIIDIWKNKKVLFDRIIRPALNNITDEKILSKPEKKQENPFTQENQQSPAQTVLDTQQNAEGSNATESLYSSYTGRTEFDEDQQFVLEILRNDSVDITPYVTPENTPEQILSLGQAFKRGLSGDQIQLLAEADVSYRAIEIVADAAEHGIDLLPYRTFAPDALEQILRGALLGVPLKKIALQGFNGRQIEQLVRAYRMSPALYEKICDNRINYNKMRDIIAGR